MVMAMGMDGRISNARREIAKTNAEDKARAALATGSRKLFNDAALAVEKISADIEAYWRIDSGRYHFQPVEEGILQSLKAFVGDILFPKPEVCGNSNITADIQALETLMKGLPVEDQELCKAVIAETRGHIRKETGVGALWKKVNAVQSPYPYDFPLSARKMNFGLDAMFGVAAARDAFHESLEVQRKHLERKAFAPE
jgi:hypothetical protein